jgi:Flp pilus assembly protein TadG
MVEMAIILPVLLSIMFGLIIGAMGIFHYQQVAMLAREGARYASVRGGQYEQETGNASATPSTIYSQAILPRAAGLDTSALNNPPIVSWTDPSKMPVYLHVASNTWKINSVTVTVTYSWDPVAIFPPMTLTSTSVMPITY